jgi:two-component system heavy metal sensor histidine kinase CusS
MLTLAVEKITTTSMHQRISPKFWPKELSALGIAFNQMLDRIETSFLKLKQFSADLAHELRTPISNLMGETEIALSYNQSLEGYRQVMESNLEELHRISHLIENILFLSHAENPQLYLEKKILNVQEEILIVIDFYQAMADEKNIQISQIGKAKLNINSVMFRRMLSNILSNAIKYTDKDNFIHFDIIEKDRNLVQITCRDTGLGIAKEHLPKIFDRFYRVDTARSNYSGGMGLGLSIAKSIVELHQGTISIISELGKGTTVTLVFPR